ncbi:MAG TPA: hypothetical protein GXX72_02420 [Clostridiaceae bacterium]|nr:hypothetical protein [Clostridiaceae bacterium]
MSHKENNLIVKLPADTSFLDEIEELLKIETYLRKKGGITSNQTIEDIKVKKGREVGERKKRIKSLINDALKAAEIYVNSQKLDIKEKDPNERINEGLKMLIDCNYMKLSYIDTFIESENDLRDVLYKDEVQMRIEKPNKLALDEVLDFIERNTIRNIPVTMKSVTDTFQKAPYGWNEEDIEGLIARLFRVQKIKLQLHSEYLQIDDRELVRYITKRDYAEKLLVEARPIIPQVLINAVKDIVKEVFGRSAFPSDEDGLKDSIADIMENENSQISKLLDHYKYADYPGRDILEEGKKVFNKILRKGDTKDFFEEIQKNKAELLDYGEYAVDVKKFFDEEGKQKEIFDRALRMVKIYKKNKTYVLDKTAIEAYEQIARIVNSSEPYREIYKLPELVDNFIDIFWELLEQECNPIRKVIQTDYDKVKEEMAAYNASDMLKDKIMNGYDDLLNRLDSANNFYEAVAMKEESDRLKLRYITAVTREAEQKEAAAGEGAGEVVIPPKKKTVSLSIAKMFRGTRNIESKADIDKLLAEIKARLESELKEDTVIKLV